MAFLGAVGNLVSKVLPKVLPAVQNILASPAGQIGKSILQQLAKSIFAKDGQQGVFSDNVQISLPNPLSRLNKLLGNVGKTVTNVSDFLSRIGQFLQGNRTLENGNNVNVPSLSDRAPTAAAQAGSTAAEIAAGNYNEAIASTTSASTASTSSASTTGGAESGSIVGGIPSAAFSTALTGDQQNMLANVKDPTQKAQMTAQFQMQNYQNLMQFISNIMRIMGDISRSVIQNIR